MKRVTLALFLLVCVAVFAGGQDESPLADTVTLAPMGAVQPALAVDAAGKLYVAFGADSADKIRQIYLKTSDDRGATWSEPELVSEGAYEVMAGNTRGPQIAFIEDTIVVTAFASFKKSDDKHLYCFRKRARDKRFTASRVSGDRAKDMEGLHHMMVDADGVMHVTWMDTRSGGTEPWYARSEDGKSFKGETAVYTAPGGTICPCCQPTVAGNGKTVVVQFRNKLKNVKDGADYNDMYAAVSTDSGKKWKTVSMDDRERWKG